MRYGNRDAADWSAHFASQMKDHASAKQHWKDVGINNAISAFADIALEDALTNHIGLLPIPAGDRLSPDQIASIKSQWASVLNSVLD